MTILWRSSRLARRLVADVAIVRDEAFAITVDNGDGDAKRIIYYDTPKLNVFLT